MIEVDLFSLDAVGIRLWRELLGLTTSEPQRFAILEALRRQQRLPPPILLEQARLAGSLGRDLEYMAALQQLQDGE